MDSLVFPDSVRPTLLGNCPERKIPFTAPPEFRAEFARKEISLTQGPR